MTIVCCNDRHIVFSRKLKQHLVDLILFNDIMPLYLNKKVFSKNIQPPFEFFFCGVFTIIQYSLWYMCPDAAGGCYESFMIFFNKLFINTRIFAVHPFNVSQ